MWSRWIACCLALSLVFQGLGVAVQRAAQGGHFHVAPLAHHEHDDDDDDDHDHHHAGHFHAAIGHHEHEANDKGVVYVDVGHASLSIEFATVLKRLALDQELLAEVVLPPGVIVESRAPLVDSPHAVRTHVAEPLEPPPRPSSV